MKVLLLHNHYRRRGGEDVVVEAEARLLRARGVEVVEAEFDNTLPQNGHLRGLVELGLESAWSRRSYQLVSDLLERHRPDLAHVHNFWLKLSPSVHSACHDAGVPTVQTLHNYRLVCLNGLLLHNGEVCTQCLGKVPWRGVARGCYRDSFLASAASARMLVENRLRQTWVKKVSAFIALSEHSRSKFAAAGLPEERLFIKPNFVDDPGEPQTAPSSSDTALYVGRLSEEKGVDLLLRAWARSSAGSNARLMILGDGPQRDELERLSEALGLAPPRVIFAGQVFSDVVPGFLSTCRVLVAPSISYETFGRVVVEAFAHGRPAIVSDQGALAELVEHHRTGLTFSSGDPGRLQEPLELIFREPGPADALGKNAYRRYRRLFTPQQNFEQMMKIYGFALGSRQNRGAPVRVRAG